MNEHVLVLGLGASGAAAAELALRNGSRLTVLDSRLNPQLEERAERLINRGAVVELDWSADTWGGEADLIVISPGIPPTSNLGRLAAAAKAPIVSELEFGFSHCNCPLLAVTGTNGKTTTVELTTHFLRSAGKRVMAAGNIGVPLSEAARKSARLDLIVVEVSSFQLEWVQQFAPMAAALLNISPDHLDRYPSMAEYLQAKLRIFASLRRPTHAILHADLMALPAVSGLPLFAAGEPITFASARSAKAPHYFVNADDWLCWRQGADVVPLVNRRDIKLKGDHNLENVMAALGLCRLAGVSHEAAVPFIRTFAPSAHRLELVASHGGVRYINDSKATNPDAMIQALKTCGEAGSRNQRRIHLIAGGRDKQMDFTLATPVLEQFVCRVYLLGETRETLHALWSPVVECAKFGSLAAIIDEVVDNVSAGDTVLLSPGCSSHDMFDDYAARGNMFAAEIKRRIGR